MIRRVSPARAFDPRRSSPLNFATGDRIIGCAEGSGQHVLAAHLVRDEGFGEGWTDDDLWGMTEQQARDTLFPTVRAKVSRYRGRIKAWVAANEVTDEGGIRINVPWYETIGPEYIAVTFGLSDRYTWLQEDRPRGDGAPRRPLPFEANLQPKPAYDAIVQAFADAASRPPLW